MQSIRNRSSQATFQRGTPPTLMARPRSHGFTLIELLVVLGVISILITLSITVGFRVLEGGKERLARDTIRLLDNSLTTWTTDKESKFPAYLEGEPQAIIPGGPLKPTKMAIIDGRAVSGGSATAGVLRAPEPTLAMFLTIARRAGSVESMIKQQVGEKYLASASLRTTYGEDLFSTDWDGLTIVDPWRQPYRFVHPVWHGGYGDFIRPDAGTAVTRPTRTVPSVDGSTTYGYSRSYRTDNNGSTIGYSDEGLCPGNRGYFYSAGPDGDPGTRGDNIYIETSRPTYPPETAPYNIE